MTFTATLSLDEAAARAVARKLGEDPAFESAVVDLTETTGRTWDVVVYFEQRPDRRTEGRLSAISAAAWTIRELPATDWVAKSLAGLAPVHAGRFLVHGRHDRDKRRPNDIAIEINAGQAFGTGHHGSTVGCLLAIDRIAKSQRIANALDVGTGSGVLAIAIAKATKASVLASDIDPVAVNVARENFRVNGVRSVTAVVASGLAGRAFRARGPFDLVVANILAGPLITLAPAIRRVVALSGSVVLSGLLAEQRARIVLSYRGQGLRLVRDIRRGEWLTLVFGRPARRPVQSG